MAKRPRKKPIPKKEPCEYLEGHHPKNCLPHGEPRDPRGKPVLCLRCNRAITGGDHKCFRHVKPKPFVKIVAEQKAADEAAEKAKTFAQRRYEAREKRVKEAKPPTREWKLDHPKIKETVKANTKSEARARFKGLLRGPIPKGSVISEVTTS